MSSIPVLPTSPLCKDNLRYVLAACWSSTRQSQIAQPDLEESLPSPAARRTAQQWAIAASLLDEQGLTPEGQLVATKDPYLEATVTDWLIHFNLSQNDRSLWHYVVYDFLPEHSSFTLDELLNGCIEGFTTASPDRSKKHLRLILRT